MYTTIDLKTLLSDKALMEKYKGYKLCYVDTISQTVFDYDEESKKIMSAPDFSWDKYSWGTPMGNLLRMCDQPNPDFELNEKELMAYFTPASLDDQWGDDWDDAPYEHNAGIPYDEIYVDKVRTEIEILQVPFAVKSYNSMLPSDFAYGGNSPYAVADINHGAAAWIYDVVAMKTKSKYVAIQGGDTLETFADKLDIIQINNKDLWEPKSLEERVIIRD